MKKRLRTMASLCLALLLSLAGGASALEEFLVGGDDTAAGGSLWSGLFGVEEPPYDGGTYGQQDADYTTALRALYEGSVVDAMNGFAKLGKFRDSVNLTDYASATLSYLRGDIETAKAGYVALGDFGDAPARVRLCDAMAVHRVRKDGKFGYADLNGETVIAPSFDWAERVFRDGSRPSGRGDGMLKPVAVVFEGTTKVENGDIVPDAGRYGLLSRDGTMLTGFDYDAVEWTQNGLAALRQGDKTVLLDTLTGARLGEPYDEALTLAEGFVPVRLGDKWAYLGADGEYLSGGFAWDSARPFREGLAAVSQNGLYGYVDATGAVKIPLQYQNAHDFGEGLAGVRWKKRWGFIDAAGNVALENLYGDTGVFSHGACAVKKGEKYGLIDATGTLITKYSYHEILPFDPVYHRAWMRYNKLWGLLSATGAVVLKPEWGTYTPFGVNGMSRVSYRNKYGYIDTMGVQLISNEYDVAAPFAAGRGGVLNADGRVEYLDRFARGFTVDGNVPTEALCGFIEGRRYVDTAVTDPVTGEESISRSLSLRLYHVDGTAITGWAQ